MNSESNHDSHRQVDPSCNLPSAKGEPRAKADASQATTSSDTSPKIPHPLDCARVRPRNRPGWEPRHTPRDAVPPRERRSAIERWHSPRLITASDGGPVRTNFTYRNYGVTSATFGFKPMRTQYAEGPHEATYQRVLETDCDVVDYQFQAAEIRWTTASCKHRSYTVDGARETADGIVFFENKASRAYFADLDISDRLQQAESFLKTLGYGFDRIVGTDLMDPIWWRVVRDVYNDRATAFEDNHVAAAIDLLAKEGGAAPLGRLHEALSADRHHARAIANAMLVRREVGFPVRHPITRDTLVHRPVQFNHPSRLRALLASHSRG